MESGAPICTAVGFVTKDKEIGTNKTIKDTANHHFNINQAGLLSYYAGTDRSIFTHISML